MQLFNELNTWVEKATYMNTEKKKSDELECGKAYWLFFGGFFSRKLHSLVDANISDFWVT